jgi:hypothetical protein
MAITRIYGINQTKMGYAVKGLVLSEDRKYLIGKGEVIDGKPASKKPSIEKVEYVNLKWEIDREKKIATCTNGNTSYDLSLVDRYIPGVIGVEKKEKRSFYTFHKNAWHCKLYKWVFGKNPHEVHPTMCPYFWIMVCVFLLLPIVVMIKMTGKGGVKFMESCTTYSRRMKEKREKAYNEKCIEFSKKMTDEQAYRFTHTKLWKKYEYYIDYEVRTEIRNASSRWYWHLDEIKTEQNRIEAEKKRIEQDKKWEAEFREKEIKQKSIEVREKRVKALKESKTSKIIGIILVCVVLYYFVWLTYICVSAFCNWVRWDWIGYGLLGIAAFVTLGFVSYLTFKYIIIPFFKFIYVKICKIKLPRVDFSKPFRKIGKFFLFIAKILLKLFRFLKPIGRTIVSGFVYMIDFFKMTKDLIYSTYKKNCPTITWKDPV